MVSSRSSGNIPVVSDSQVLPLTKDKYLAQNKCPLELIVVGTVIGPVCSTPQEALLELTYQLPKGVSVVLEANLHETWQRGLFLTGPRYFYSGIGYSKK
jgi:hypothetical protein